jgi:hypothetical protein
MNVHEYRFLLSQQATLNRLLNETDQSEVIVRISLNARLQEVEEQLESYEGLSPHLVSGSLTFRGSPVTGNRGIDAEFGPDAVKSFANAVSFIGAIRHMPLSSTGRVPHREDYRLLITNTARGSFGFQFEEASQQPAFSGESTPVEMAIAQVKEILEASVGTDEQLSEAIEETDRRALGVIRSFLKIVADGDAVCALEFQGDVFRFTDVAQVRRSENRLSEDNIQEEEVTLTGHFAGFLPNSRRAEFYVESAEADFLLDAIGTVISGKVESDVDDTVGDLNEILKRTVRIDAHTRRVGEGRPRYIITNCNTNEPES